MANGKQNYLDFDAGPLPSLTLLQHGKRESRPSSAPPIGRGDCHDPQDHHEKAAVAEAAAQKGVNSGSLLRCYHRNTSKLLAHGNRLLSDKDEQILVWTLQAFSRHNMALTLTLCRSLISKLFDKTPSKPWLAKFMKRHSKELRAGATKQLSKARNAKGLLTGRANAFAKQAEDFLDDHKLPANAIFNYDETILAASGNKLVLKRINSKNRSRMNSQLQRSSSLGPMISFISANGNHSLHSLCAAIFANRFSNLKCGFRSFKYSALIIRPPPTCSPNFSLAFTLILLALSLLALLPPPLRQFKRVVMIVEEEQ